MSVLVLGALVSLACAPRVIPPALTQAEAISESKAAEEARTYAPQAFAAAEKLRAEARFLLDGKREEEASAASEQAIAAYTLAFSLSRVARAEERREAAQKAHDAALMKAAELDHMQASVAKDADTYELRAKVHLDTEAVSDVDSVSPSRAKARRTAAQRLSAEAGLLCLAARLLGEKSQKLGELEKSQTELQTELDQGSVKNDLYPRAAGARAACLTQLTQARRPAQTAHPESAEADSLLTALTETGTLFAYRDDRGIVVQVGSPVGPEGKLTEATERALKLLGGTSRANPQFPLLVVVHTKKASEKERAEQMGNLVSEALKNSGAAQVTVHSVFAAQPVVSAQLQGAEGRNERIEVVFVTPGR